MINLLEGKILVKKPGSVLISVNGVGYEVLLPGAVADELSEVGEGDTVTLYTSFYLTATPNRITPLLVGFTNQIEREFFEQFISVSGIGPKAAARCLTLPFARVARAVIEGDEATLSLLPGIGRKKAAGIIHELKDRVGSAALLREPLPTKAPEPRESLLIRTASVLNQLGYKQNEIREMLDSIRGDADKYETVEEMLASIYARRGKPGKTDE